MSLARIDLSVSILASRTDPEVSLAPHCHLEGRYTYNWKLSNDTYLENRQSVVVSIFVNVARKHGEAWRPNFIRQHHWPDLTSPEAFDETFAQHPQELIEYLSFKHEMLKNSIA